MAWTTPKTWTDEEKSTAAQLNAIGANLTALRNPGSDSYTLNEGSDYTTTSTTFTNVDNTNLNLTITTRGGVVFCHFHGNVSIDSADALVYFDIAVDGTRVGGADGIWRKRNYDSANASRWMSVSLKWWEAGLDADSHNFRLMWRVSAGTATLSAGAGTASQDTHGQFFVREIS